jgi:hypothetical protein
MSSFIKDSISEKDTNYYNIAGIFYKGDDFLKARALIESALKLK